MCHNDIKLELTKFEFLNMIILNKKVKNIVRFNKDIPSISKRFKNNSN